MSAVQCPARDQGFPCVRVCGHEGQHQNKSHPRIRWGPSDAQRLALQSARIAELEAEVTHWKTHAKMMAKVADNHKAHEKTLETERDAVRKALAFGAARSVVILADHISFMVNELADRKMHHDGTGAGVEAALLAAARKGGAP